MLVHTYIHGCRLKMWGVFSGCSSKNGSWKYNNDYIQWKVLSDRRDWFRHNSTKLLSTTERRPNNQCEVCRLYAYCEYGRETLCVSIQLLMIYSESHLLIFISGMDWPVKIWINPCWYHEATHDNGVLDKKSWFTWFQNFVSLQD